MSKVLLFACIEKNIGDDLFVYLMCKRYPHIQFTISEEANYGALSQLPNLNFSKKLSKWHWADGLKERKVPKRAIGTILERKYRMELGEYDIAVYIVGNAFKNLDYKGKRQIQWLYDQVNLVKRFYLLSTNFGPFIDKRWIIDCGTVFRLMADVCFRDIQSQQYFPNFDNVRFAPDAVLSMGKQENHGNKLVVISVIDFSFTGRKNLISEKAAIYEERMADIADAYIERGYRVVLLNSNTIQDKPACIKIKNLMKHSDKVEQCDYEGDLHEIFSLYSSACRVISTRLHTMVLAWLYSVPVFPIEYDVKVTNVMETCRFKQPSVKIDYIKDLTFEFVENAFAGYDFELDEKVIIQSNEQFLKLDTELLNTRIYRG